MEIISKPMGAYQTNCYILKFDGFEFVIDTGVDSKEWVLENTDNLRAIILTHGHFDHIWDSLEISQELNIPIYVNKNDLIFFYNKPMTEEFQNLYKDKFVNSDNLVTFEDNLSKTEFWQEFDVNGIKVKTYFLAGHTPGSTLIEIENHYFSGDILFKGTIGRTDFELSDSKKMSESLEKLLTLDKNKIVYSGHGEATTIEENINIIKYFIEALK